MSSTGVGVVSQLNISRSRVEDGGLYTCVALEGDHNTVHSARVDVYGELDILVSALFLFGKEVFVIMNLARYYIFCKWFLNLW